jgi:hypothetical protein
MENRTKSIKSIGKNQSCAGAMAKPKSFIGISQLHPYAIILAGIAQTRETNA